MDNPDDKKHDDKQEPAPEPKPAEPDKKPHQLHDVAPKDSAHHTNNRHPVMDVHTPRPMNGGGSHEARPDPKPAEKPAPDPAPPKPTMPVPSEPTAPVPQPEPKPVQPPDPESAEPSKQPTEQKSKDTKPVVKKPPKPPRQPGVSLAIVASIIVILGLGLLATYAYLRTNGIAVF